MYPVIVRFFWGLGFGNDFEDTVYCDEHAPGHRDVIEPEDDFLGGAFLHVHGPIREMFDEDCIDCGVCRAEMGDY